MSKSGKVQGPMGKDHSQLIQLFDANPTGMVLVDTETRIIQQVNTAAAKLIGLPADQIVGKVCHGFFCPADAQTCPVLDMHQKVDRSERFLITANGEKIPILKTVVPLTIHGEDYLLESFIDITERKQVEHSLQESENKYRMLFETHTDGIAVADVETKKFLHVNPAGQRLFGYSETEFLQLKAEDIHPPESWAKVRAEFEAQARGEKTLAADIPCVRKNGTVFHADINANSLLIQDKLCSVGFFRDITKRKKIESQQQKMLDQLTMAQQAACAGMWEWDLQTQKITWSPELYRLAGLDPDRDTASFETWRTALHPDDRGAAEQHLRDAAEKRVPLEMENRIIRPSGEVRWIRCFGNISCNEQGRPTHMAGICLDVTDRKQSDTFLSLVLDSIPDFVFWKDRNSVFLGCNQAFARIAGLDSPEQIVGKTDYDLAWKKEETDFYIQVDRRVMESDQAEYHIQEPQLQVGGKQTWIETCKVPLHDEQGQVIGILGTFMDITERKQAEEHLQSSEEMLEEAQDIAGLGSYVLNIQTGVWEGSRMMDCVFGIDTTYDHSLDGWVQLLHPDDRESIVSYFRDHVFAKGEPFDNEYRIIRQRDQAERWVHGLGRLEFDQAGTPIKMIGTIQDITERKKAEAKLMASEKKFQAYLERSPVCTKRVDPDLLLRYMSRAGIQALKIDHVEDYYGKPFPLDLYPEPSRTKMRQDLEEAKTTGKRIEQESMVLDMHGNERWFHASIQPIQNDQGQLDYLLVVSRDITEKKKAEAQIRLHAQLLDSVKEAVVASDLDGRILYWGRGAELLYGYTAEEVQGKAYRDVAGSIEPVDESAFREYIIREGAWHGEHVQKSRDGKTFWTATYISLVRNEQGEPAGYVGIDQDISERKRAEDRLRKINEGLLRLGPDSDQNIQQLTALCGELLGATCALYNRLNGDLLCSTGQWQTPPDYQPTDHPEGHICYDVIRRGNDEPLVVEHLSATPYAQSDPNVSRYHLESYWGHGVRCGKRIRGSLCVVFQQNITPTEEDLRLLGIIASSISNEEERKQAKAKQLLLEAELQQAQKLESIGRLAGGVSHDFNNMLGVILGRVEMALESMEIDHPLYEDLTEIQRAAGRSADFTRQLLAFARKQTVQPQILDLNEAVNKILTMLNRLIGEQIELTWLPDKNLWPIRIDPSQIDQLLTNLCVNARDAITGIGRITIETGTATFKEEDCEPYDGCVPGDYIMLSVRDTGHGMSRETLEHIFEPFFTTKAVGEGTGLGLATAYGAVHQNNGFIDVDSEPGEGTLFRVYLPRHIGPKDVQPTMEAHPTPHRGQETILVVEDEPSILKMTAKMLSRQGYEVVTASTPGEAIRLAREKAGGIDLLITDVVMPEMNGRDLAKNLLQLYPDLKRLFMSGYTADVIAHNGVLDDGVCFIQKPFAHKQLATQVRQALDATDA